jgi:hypothetical protein
MAARSSGESAPAFPPRVAFVHLTGNRHSEKARDAIRGPLTKAAEGDGWELYVTP